MRSVTFACTVVLLAACGGRETMASKSAAAYRETQSKGTAVSGGHEHAHGDVPATTTDAPAHHAAERDASGAHAEAGHAGHREKETVDHSAHRAAPSTPHEGHTAPPATSRATPDPHAQHRQPATAAPSHAHGEVSERVTAPTSSRETGENKPAATLEPDEFDTAVAVSVSEASKPVPTTTHDHNPPEDKP